ncbi:MAG: PAS domain S-box protein [Myxococcota bacterium]
MGESRHGDPKSQHEIRVLREFLGLTPPGGAGGAGLGIDVTRLEDRFDYLLESLRALTFDVDADGRIACVSGSCKNILGYAPGEMIGRSTSEFVNPEDAAAARATARLLRESGTPLRNVFRLRHKDGHRVWMAASAGRAVRSTDGCPYTVVFAQDVTDVMKATEALTASEDRYRALADNASDIITEVDRDGRLRYLSPSFEAVTGRDASEFVGKRLSETDLFANLHPDDSKRLGERFHRGLGAGRPVESLLAYRFRHADGSWRWFESRTTPYVTGRGEAREVVLSRDVTEQVLAEAELRESEARYRILAEASRDVIIEMDEEARILWHSPGTEQALGYAEKSLVGEIGFHLVHPDDLEGIVDVFGKALGARGAVFSAPFRLRHRDGRWRWFEGVGVTYRRADGELRIVAVNHDITLRRKEEEQRRELEERVRQAQKLEGLGVMAGGIAHDFNNLLTPILGDASLALMELPEDSPVRWRIGKIRKTALRAAALTNQMLAYAGSGPVAAKPIDLTRVVREMAQLLETSIADDTVLEYRLDAGLARVSADDTQVGQVVMNLLSNAVEALGDEGGRITIETGALEIDDASGLQTVLGQPLETGSYAFLEVRDSGCGMDDDTRSRIFDPFFTTKFTGRGLGLAAVLGIVRGHSGAIDLESEPGRGTRFRVLFPCCDSPGETAAPEPLAAGEWRGAGTILVVDDDESVRELTAETLERAGLTVLCAGSGREGVESFRRHRDDIRAVFLDRTMPDLSGERVFDEIRRMDANVAVILMSGYSEERAILHFAAADLSGFLQKPYLPETLIDKVREALEN